MAQSTHLQEKVRHNESYGAADTEAYHSPWVIGRSQNLAFKGFLLWDVEILVESYWDAWKKPIPNEKHKGLHEGISLDHGWPGKLGFKSWLMLSHPERATLPV